MDTDTANHLGYLLSLGEVAPRIRNYLLRNITNSQLDALCEVILNVVYENLTLSVNAKRKLAVFGPLMVSMCVKSKGRTHKKSILLKYSRFVKLLLQSVRTQLLQLCQKSMS